MIQRDSYLKQLIASMGNGMVKVITGLRRSGKSYLLFNIFCDYLKKSGVDSSHIITLALDDLANQKYWNPNELDKYLRSKILNDGKMTYILIDEIQFVSEVENPYLEGSKVGFTVLILGLMKLPYVDIYVTGSNSRMLSSDIATEFRGRGDEIRVHPLSFREFYDSISSQNEKSQAFEAYLAYGGMPQVYSFIPEKRSEYLKSLLLNAYIKDIIDRNNLKNDSQPLGELLDCIASSVGSLTSPKKLADTFTSVTKKKISSQTISNYLSYFEDAFLISKSTRYDIKGRAYIDSPYKYYFEDIGLRNARLGFREQDKTHIMENIIYNELIARGFNVDVGVVEHFLKNSESKTQRVKYEIDFVCNKADQRFYIQSAYALPDNEKIEQEIRGFRLIGDSYKKIVVVRDNRIPLKDENGILYIGIEEFLLNDKYTSKFV